MASEVLRSYIRSLISEESPVSVRYRSKEDIRTQIQSQLVSLVEAGELKSQEDVLRLIVIEVFFVNLDYHVLL